jgi:hypothetical protein
MSRLLLITGAMLAVAASVAAAAAAPTVTIDAERSTITFGGTVTLSGTASPVTPGQKVTVVQTPQDGPAHSTQVTPGSDGSYSLDIEPQIQTQVQAKYMTATSQPQVIFVRPRIGLRKFGRSNGFGRFAVSVVAARSFTGKYVWITRWNRRTHRWVNIKRVFLTRYVESTGASTAAFKLRINRRVKLRAFLNTSQARPGYVAGHSNFILS